jgi:predicted ATP-grasp superfamily ATP-dependent carboligase
MSFDSKRCYLQEWIDGISHAAIFLGQPSGPTLLLGVTRQLIGEPSLHAAPFQYCGSVGPVELPAPVLAMLTRVGKALVDDLGLRGCFGVDFILNVATPWPVEVNPRYTASVEVLERATGKSLLALHADVFTGRTIHEFEPAGRRCHGKYILFAHKPLMFPAHGPWEVEGRLALDDPSRRFADIPSPGEPINAGQPVMTLFGPQEELPARIAELAPMTNSVSTPSRTHPSAV